MGDAGSKHSEGRNDYGRNNFPSFEDRNYVPTSIHGRPVLVPVPDIPKLSDDDLKQCSIF